MADTFSGVFTAMVTPMTADQQLDLDALAKLTEHLIGHGIHGLCPLGSTGEYYALSDEERLQVIETVIKTADGRVPVVPGTNSGGTQQIVEYSKQAEQAGAAGVLLAAPYYSLPTDDELFEHFRAISDGIGIPIMLYNYPGRTGVDMDPALVARMADIENVKYIKESSGDIPRVSEIIDLCGDRMTVFCGCDTGALESFVSGAVGWVSGAPNFLPAEHVKMFELSVVQRDFEAARQHGATFLPILRLLESGKYTQLVKHGCGLKGYPVGPTRQPLLPVSAEEGAVLKELVDGLGG